MGDTQPFIVYERISDINKKLSRENPGLNTLHAGAGVFGMSGEAGLSLVLHFPNSSIENHPAILRERRLHYLYRVSTEFRLKH